MRIGHVAYSYKPVIGGCETYIATLFGLFKKRGVSQRVYQAKMKGASGSELRLVPAWKFLRRKPLYSYNLMLNMYVRSLVREDLLIVHDAFHFVPVAWHPRTVVLSHGVRWDRKDKSERLYCKVHYWSARLAMRSSKVLVANDSNFYRQLGYGIKPKEGMFSEVEKGRWFIPNCVDGRMFKRGRGIEELKKMNPIIVPRNLVRGRGIHLAISAYDIFRRDYNDTTLIICGDSGDVDYRRELFRQIGELGLVGRVFFLGGVEWRQMARVYSSGLMTVIPTLYEEGTSLAALESMACGTAVVSTDVGGLADLPTVQAKPEVKTLARVMVESFRERGRISEEQEKEVRGTYNMKNFREAWMKAVGMGK